MSTVSAYAATSATEPLTKTTITRRDVGPHDVAFDIHFAGICHSDIHTVRAEWGKVKYPMVPGHEIAGIVTEVGSEVTKYKVGDRVGVGCFVDSCRECAQCRAGEEQYCTTPAWSAPTTASAATASRRRAATAARSSSTRTTCCAFPTRIPLDKAAPLLCAGITTVFTAAALERRARASGSPSSASAGSATSASSWPPRWAPRSRCSASR